MLSDVSCIKKPCLTIKAKQFQREFNLENLPKLQVTKRLIAWYSQMQSDSKSSMVCCSQKMTCVIGKLSPHQTIIAK